MIKPEIEVIKIVFFDKAPTQLSVTKWRGSWQEGVRSWTFFLPMQYTTKTMNHLRGHSKALLTCNDLNGWHWKWSSQILPQIHLRLILWERGTWHRIWRILTVSIQLLVRETERGFSHRRFIFHKKWLA